MLPEAVLPGDKKERFAGWGFPAALGFAFACGTNASTDAIVPFDKPYFYVQWMLFAVLFLMVFRIGFKIFQMGMSDGLVKTLSKTSVSKKNFSLLRFEHGRSKKSKLKDSLRILVAWSPYIILLYPGVLYWDTGDQVAQFFGFSAFGQKPGEIWDHHPFFDTYLYGGFIWLGHAITGSYNVGIFLYAIAQCIFVAVTLACWLSYLKERSIGRLPLRICTMFLCFFPIFPIAFMGLSKDITHASFFIAWLLMFMRLVDSKLEKIKQPSFFFGFLILGLCSSLSKKMGMYIILFCLIILIFGKFKIRFKAVVVSIAAFLFAIVSIILPNYYYPKANIVPGGGQAAFAMPIELLGRSAHAYPQDLGVEGGYAVDGEAKVDVHVGHVDGVVLVDDGDARVIVLGLRDLIELDDNVGDGRGDLLQAGERPLLERLGKNRVVSVGDHGAYNGHGLVKLDAMLGGEQANELGDDHGGVRVVNLDHGIVGQIVQVAAALDGLVDQELGGVAHHEVLLIDAK